MKYTKEEMLSKVDHTLLKPEATWPQIRTLCDEVIANHCASVCINTCYVKQAVEYMAGRVPVCCVVGFPLGAMDTKSKAFEAKTAIENGASEVDMVINIGWLKNKQYDDVRNDIAAVKAAVGDKVLKVIIETCLLTDDEKIKMCDIVPEAGADFIKTSTGFPPAVRPSTTLSCSQSTLRVAARSRLRAASPPSRTSRSSSTLAQTASAPPVPSSCSPPARPAAGIKGMWCSFFAKKEPKKF